MKRFVSIFVLLLLVASAEATTVDGRFVVLVNNGTTYQVKVQIKVDVAAGLGGTTLAFTYNTADLSYPFNAANAFAPVAGTDYSFFAYSGVNNYSAATVSHPLANKLSVNIEYNGATGSGTVVNTTYTDVATITFTTLNAQGSSQLTWVTRQAIGDDGTTIWTPGSFVNESTTPLPIQLASFNAIAGVGNQVRLNWRTISEINNYGFEVQRSADKLTGFQTLAGSFQAGHGTTLEAHAYAWTDPQATASAPWYRLKQTDLDQSVHYSEAQQVGGLASVRETAPLEFQLLQNYPNPFNPATQITFSVKQTGPASLKLYSMLGQEVATLFEGLAEAGQYYRLTLDGHRLASGVYLYRLVSGDKKDIKRLVLMK